MSAAPPDRVDRLSRSGIADLGLVLLHVAGLVASSALLAAHGLGVDAGWAAEVEHASAEGPWSRPGVAALVLALRFALIPALVEETLFRGLFYGMLRRIAGPAAAIVGGALLFALVHRSPDHALAAGLLGLQLGLIRERHGLALAALAHATNDALALTLVLSRVPPVPPVDPTRAITLLAFAALAGSSIAALWQGFGSAGPRRFSLSGPASGDSRIGRRPKTDAIATDPADAPRRAP